jgi:hypothetical protein
MGIAYNPSVVTDGLVLCLDAGNPKSYPGSGTAWGDISTTGAVGTWDVSPTFSSNNGGTIQVTNNGPRLSFTQIPLNDPNKFTVMVWGNFQTYVGTTRPRYISINQSGSNLQFGHNDTGFNNQLYLRHNSVLYAAPALNPNQWSQYVVSKNDSTVLFYINGVVSTTTSTTVPTANAVGNVIGGYSATTGNTLTGFLGQANYYNRTLSSQEIQQNFNALRGRYGI